MTEKFSLEVNYEIWDDQHGVKLTVGPDDDTSGWVQISTRDEKSKEYYGDIRLVLPPEAAILLSQALAEAATELMEKK